MRTHAAFSEAAATRGPRNKITQAPPAPASLDRCTTSSAQLGPRWPSDETAQIKISDPGPRRDLQRGLIALASLEGEKVDRATQSNERDGSQAHPFTLP